MCQKFRKAALNKFQIITFSGATINAMKSYIIKALKYLFQNIIMQKLCCIKLLCYILGYFANVNLSKCLKMLIHYYIVKYLCKVWC